jgi:ferric-dicitrate binding protein FerR (iron transport regulator)
MISQDRFSELLAKELAGALSPEEAKELRSMLDDETLKDRYALLQLYLRDNDAAGTEDDALFAKIQTRISSQEAPAAEPGTGSQTRFYWKAASIAAVLLLISSLMFVFYFLDLTSNKQVATQRASKRTIRLDDGTKVVLNADSKLVYPESFTGKNREVTLIGEAYFDVTKDAERPFIIHTEKMDVRVLGTAFNVKSYPEDKFTEATLIHGKIEVTLKDRPTDRITLSPNEKLTIKNEPVDAAGDHYHDETLAQITHLKKTDSHIAETSWMYDRIEFRNETFQDIARKLERTYDVRIRFQNDSLAGLKFTGSFEKEPVTNVLQALSLLEHFSFSMDGDEIVIK